MDVNQEGLKKNQNFKKKRKKKKKKREKQKDSRVLLTAPELSAGPQNKERKIFTEKKCQVSQKIIVFDFGI